MDVLVLHGSALPPCRRPLRAARRGAQVVSVKLEVEPERFDADPEGLHLAQDVNRHLPPEARPRRTRRSQPCTAYAGRCQAPQVRAGAARARTRAERRRRRARAGARAERAARQPLLQRAHRLPQPHLRLLPARRGAGPAPGRRAPRRPPAARPPPARCKPRPACSTRRQGGKRPVYKAERLKKPLHTIGWKRPLLYTQGDGEGCASSGARRPPAPACACAA